ncbi:MAG: hypothetical protein KGL39_51190 [Patescibacteria group bacterium]|nr:hypothetical protein [Patescibacteria group bacterium]
MKTKTIEIDGESFIIAPLNVAQVEEHIATGDPAIPEKEARIRAYDLICCGLNNALPKITVNGASGPDGPLWTHERVRDELTWPAYIRLQREIMALSGFSAIEEKKAPTGGEAGAPFSNVLQ